MATKTTGQTLQSLQQQIAQLEAQANTIREKEKGQVVEQVKKAIRDFGLTAADLGFGTKRKTSAPATNPDKPKRGRKATGKKTARAAKFADGQGNTWSGIGKRPNWFKEALASGKTPEDLMASS